jgi:hypothetical protein
MATAHTIKKKRVFVSHAAKDKPLADALVDLLETGASIPAKEIFCSSLEGLGIPSGKDFITHIKEQIQHPEVVVLLLSQNYLASQFCLCELGASWAMTHNILPLLVPPLTVGDVKGVLTATQIDRINSTDDLNRFLEAIQAHLSIEINIPRWDVKKNKFLGELGTLLASQPKPEIVPAAEHEALKKQYDNALGAYAAAQDDVERLQAIVAELKKCKDSDGVRKVVRKYEKGLPAVEAELLQFGNSLEKLPAIAVYVMFREFTGASSKFDPWSERDAMQEAEKAVENGYLDVDEEGFTLNQRDPTIKAVWRKLERLNKYLRSSDVDQETETLFEEENGYELSLSNRRLWEAYMSPSLRRF